MFLLSLSFLQWTSVSKRSRRRREARGLPSASSQQQQGGDTGNLGSFHRVLFCSRFFRHSLSSSLPLKRERGTKQTSLRIYRPPGLSVDLTTRVSGVYLSIQDCLLSHVTSPVHNSSGRQEDANKRKAFSPPSVLCTSSTSERKT